MQSTNRQRTPTYALSITQAAQETGISYDTIRRAINDRELQAFRPGRGRQRGGKFMVRRTALIDWIRQMELLG